MILLLVFVACFCILLYKYLVVDYKKACRGSEGKCDDCEDLVGIRYSGSGRNLCQFCDDKSIGMD